MTFFGITHLGYQNHIREHVCNPKITPQHVYEAGLFRDPKYLQPRLEKTTRHTLPPKDCADRTCRYGQGHGNSYYELNRLQMEHIVSPKGPEEIYRLPPLTSHDIGRWRKDEPLRCREPWTHIKRNVSLLSEMSRFVDDVAKKDRIFSLF